MPSANMPECWAFGPFGMHAVADLAGDPRLGRVLERRREADAVQPHGGPALHEAGLALHPVEAGEPGRAVLGVELGVELGRLDRRLAVGVHLRRAGRSSRRPSRAAGSSTPRRSRSSGPRLTQPETPLPGSFSALRGLRASRRRSAGRRGRLRLEQVLVVVDQVVVDVDREGVDPAVGLRRPDQPRLGEVLRSRSRAPSSSGRRAAASGRRASRPSPPAASARAAPASARRSEVAPEANSIAAFWRCCCSGTCSEPTSMPVSSVNSFSYFCSTSDARALGEQHLDLLALEPLPVEGALGTRARPEAEASPRPSAAPVLRKPRRCVGPNGKPELVVIAPTLIWSRTGGPAVVRVGRRCSGRIRRSIPRWRLPGLRRGGLAPASAASLPARARLARRRQTHRLRQVGVVRRLVRDRHGGDEMLLEARLDRGLDLLDPLDHAPRSRPRASRLSSAMRAPVPAALPAEPTLSSGAVGDHAQHHGVFRVDVAAEGAGERDAVDAARRRAGPSAAARRHRARPWRAGWRARRSG